MDAWALCDLGDEGGCHRADECAVVELEHHFGADGEVFTNRRHDEVVATGTEDFHARRRVEAVRIGVLAPDGKDRLRDVASIWHRRRISKRGLGDLAPWL